MNRFNVRSNCVSPFRLEPADRHHSTKTEAEKARVAKIQQMGRKRSADLRLLLSDARQGRHRADFCGAHERDLPDEQSPVALDPSRRRLDPADHRRARHAGAEVVVLTSSTAR